MNRSWNLVRFPIIALFCLSWLTWAGAGCATYVNIPAQEDDVASNLPSTRNAMKVYIAALIAAGQDQAAQDATAGGTANEIGNKGGGEGGEGGYQFVLPAGAKPLIYQRVQAALDQAGQNAHWSDQPPAEASASLTIKGLRIRGTQAEVDIFRSSGFRSSQGRPVDARLLTVYLRWFVVDGWQADRVRTWRVDPNQPTLFALPPAASRPASPNP